LAAVGVLKALTLTAQSPGNEDSGKRGKGKGWIFVHGLLAPSPSSPPLGEEGDRNESNGVLTARQPIS